MPALYSCMSGTNRIVETLKEIASERAVRTSTREVVRDDQRRWVKIRVYDCKPPAARNLGRELYRRVGGVVTEGKRYEYRYTEFSTVPVGTVYTFYARPVGE